MVQPFINLGIFAHVDGGKTTITEQLLYTSGALRTLGSVDKGTTQTDSLSVEKERGISVRLAETSFEYQGTTINLIDTPGHADFSMEVERTLNVLDVAILVVSAVEGVQSQTEMIWQALQEKHIPTLLFINKTDRTGSNTVVVLNELRNECSSLIFPFQSIKNEETDTPDLASVWNEAFQETLLLEAVCEQNETLLNTYLNEKRLPFSELESALKGAISKGKIFPLLFGSAKNGIGIQELLDVVFQYFPKAEANKTAPLSAIVYKVDEDKTLGRVCAVRVFSGELHGKTVIKNYTKQMEEKAGIIRKRQVKQFQDLQKLTAGNAGLVYGLSETQVGDILGEPPKNYQAIQLQSPLITVQVVPQEDHQLPELVKALHQLTDENPTLALDWLKDERELHINVMGDIQLEILEHMLRERFGLNVTFKDPTVIYKETPSKTAEGFVRYWMPKPCWALMTFKLEPGERGSGVSYTSVVPTSKIEKKYQKDIEKTIPKALKQGIKGWEVTDIKITLIDGEDHVQHTKPWDFAIATPMGIMDGLVNTDTTLLEPMISAKITVPEDFCGTIIGDIIQMRGRFESPEIELGKANIHAIIPVSTSINYAIELSSKTSGKGKFRSKFFAYEPCEVQHGKTTPFRGISPLDREKYILRARKAL